MKPVFAIIAALLVLFTGVGTVAAQSYEGTSLEEGIFFVPAEPGPGSIINFAVAGLAPNSELEIRFVDEDRNEVDGLTEVCLLYTSPSPRDRTRSRMPSSA